MIIKKADYEQMIREYECVSHELDLLRSRLEYLLGDYEPDVDTYPEEGNIMDDIWMYLNEPESWFELNEIE